MARRKPPPTNEEFRTDLLDLASRHRMWPNEKPFTGGDFGKLQTELMFAHRDGDQERAIEAAAPYGYSREAVLRAWRGW